MRSSSTAPKRSGTPPKPAPELTARRPLRRILPPALALRQTMPPSDGSSGGVRIQYVAVMLTYNGLTGLEHWARLTDWVRAHAHGWGIVYWTPTLETTRRGVFHSHVMFQFRKLWAVNPNSFPLMGSRRTPSPTESAQTSWARGSTRRECSRASTGGCSMCGRTRRVQCATTRDCRAAPGTMRPLGRRPAQRTR